MSPVPLTAGLLASWAALTPSLVPRRWWMTAASVAAASALASGAAQAVGAGVRAVPGLLGRSRPAPVRDERGPRPGLRSTAGAGVLGASAVGIGVSLARSAREQSDVARVTGVGDAGDGDRIHHLAGYGAGLIGWAVLDATGRVSRRLRARIGTRLRQRLPIVPPVIVTGALVVVTVRIYGWVLSRALARADTNAVIRSFATLGAGPGPVEPERSGSRSSAEPYATMGLHGRDFVTGGPRRDRIAEVMRTTRRAGEAREPIRVFVGRLGHPDPKEAAAAAVAELERTGAFERRAILMVTGTGSGWVPPWSTAAFEHLMGGDCAVVSAQYSFAGSWLAFLIHRGPAREIARAVHRAVRARLRALPPERRPLLYAAGESLGAFGGHGAFRSAGAMLRGLDGAVWTGTPRTTGILAHVLRDRRHGSTEVRPVYGTGRHIRVVTRPEDLGRAPEEFAYSSWGSPRIVYAQHPSDPVVWWGPALLLRRPDWLREPRGFDVAPGVRWRPFATFWQLTADMPRSVELPGGHGHSYHAETVHYWNAVLRTGLTDAQCDAIGRAIGEDLAPSTGALPLTDTGARLRRGAGG